MVAISTVVYKGNLHKVPDVPRKWLMPTPQISFKHFKSLLRRRSRALLSRLPPTLTVSDLNPNPNPNFNITDHNNNNNNNNNTCGIHNPLKIDGEIKEEMDVVEGAEDRLVSDGRDHPVSDSAPAAVVDEEGEEGGAHNVAMVKIELNAVEDQHQEKKQIELNAVEDQHQEKKQEDEDEPHNPATQTISEEDAESDEGKRKREIEEKLKILKERKHNLVQVLKQIQNAEEELKRRNSMQGMAVRPSVPLQVDIPNDTGSITRLNTPRMGSDGILVSEMEGEPDGMSNHNTDTRHLLRMNSTSPSPSSDSQHKKPAFNAVPHTARTSLGVSSSPSRFAPTGQQGQTSNLPTVSVSGTNYVASSLSPAASGGTSVFRENRIPSPFS